MNSVQNGNYTIQCGDCKNLLKDIPSESIDLIITDPPYGMNYHQYGKKDKGKFGLYDDETFFQNLEKPIIECERILKEGSAIYCFCSSHNVDQFVSLFKRLFKFKSLLVWVKNNWSAGDLKGDYGTKTEFIIYAVKGRHLLNGKRNHNVLEYKRIPPSKQYYPFEKPVEMLEFLIKKSSTYGDTVLDPYMGSGSTIVACENLGRKGIGFELKPEVFQIAKNRLVNRLEAS